MIFAKSNYIIETLTQLYKFVQNSCFSVTITLFKSLSEWLFENKIIL